MRIFKNAFLISVFFLVTSLSAHANSTHDLFDGILKQNVSDEGHVNYPGIKADPRFGEYLDYLAKTDPETFASKDEKLAFWINAYNALAIKGILDGLSPDGFFSRITYFKNTEFELAGREISLYDLEHDIIIPFQEPRIHFAIVCASASCPKLIPEAYTADKLEQQLEKNTISFINNDFKNKFNLEEKTADISKIFDWFDEDFERHSGTVQKYLANYVKDSEISKLLAQNKMSVDHLTYDWSLNGTSVK